MHTDFIAHSLDELNHIARTITSLLKGGDIVALKGEMGSGKTTLANMIAKHLGCADTVTSPTYVVVKNYVTAHPVVQRICHMDAWRLDSSHNLSAVIDEHELGEKNTLALIEWPDNIKLQKKYTVRITITAQRGSDTRTLIFERLTP